MIVLTRNTLAVRSESRAAGAVRLERTVGFIATDGPGAIDAWSSKQISDR